LPSYSIVVGQLLCLHIAWVGPYITLVFNGYVAVSRTVQCQCDAVRLVSVGKCGGLILPERCATRGNDCGADCPMMPVQR
jgi:hypothetical protein